MQISNDNIKEFWDNSFISYTKHKLKEIIFHSDTISFLCDVGLPFGEKSERLTMKKFYTENETEACIINGDNYLTIGKHSAVNAKLYIRSDTGNFFIPKADYSGLCYINKNIRDYLVFQQIAITEFEKIENEFDEKENFEVVQKLKKIFTEMDPITLEEDSYWNEFLWPYEIGMF